MYNLFSSKLSARWQPDRNRESAFSSHWQHVVQGQPLMLTPNIMTGILIGGLWTILFLVGFCCLFNVQTPAAFEELVAGGSGLPLWVFLISPLDTMFLPWQVGDSNKGVGGKSFILTITMAGGGMVDMVGLTGLSRLSLKQLECRGPVFAQVFSFLLRGA
eukprot:Skav235019  [mRNA]  locus=scaffold276:341002:342003:+ [translate_table: standard]